MCLSVIEKPHIGSLGILGLHIHGKKKLFCLSAVHVVTVTESDCMLSNAFVTNELERLCNEAAMAQYILEFTRSG